jgi:hypothetical protein
VEGQVAAGKGVDCALVGFDDTASATLSDRLGAGGTTLCLAETLEGSATAGITVWNIPSDLSGEVVAQALTASEGCVLCVAPPALGAGFCLKNGAADAITRPWQVDELLARTERLIARPQGARTITYGAVTVCLRTGEVSGRPVASGNDHVDGMSLRASELNVLRYLARAKERYVPIEELQARALGATGDGTAVRFHIKELRRKLGPGVIQTRRGFGYRLTEAPSNDSRGLISR